MRQVQVSHRAGCYYCYYYYYYYTNTTTILELGQLGSRVVLVCSFHLRVPISQLNTRKKDTLSVKGTLGNLGNVITFTLTIAIIIHEFT